MRAHRDVVVTHERNILGHTDPILTEAIDGSDCNLVIQGNDGRRQIPRGFFDQLAGKLVAVVEGVMGLTGLKYQAEIAAMGVAPYFEVGSSNCPS